MKKFAFILLIVFLSFQKTEASDPVRKVALNLDSITKSLERAEIRKVRISWLPSDLKTRTTISAEMFDRQYYYALEILNGSENEVRKSLLDIFRSVNVAADNGLPDLRWRIEFEDLNGTKVGSVYFSTNGEMGYLDGKVVTFKRAISVSKIREMLSSLVDR